jgi:hypothetical protein
MVFQLLLSLEDLIGQLKQLDYSYEWAISYSEDRTDRVIRCLEQHVGDIRNSLNNDRDLYTVNRCLQIFTKT